MRRAASIALAVVMLLLGSAYLYFTQPHRLAVFAGQILQTLTGAEVRIESASFTLDGQIDLREVRLLVPGLAGEGGELFAADQVLMQIDPWSLLAGRFVPGRLMLSQPIVSLTDVGEGQFNYELLRQARKARDGQDRAFDFTLPRVHVRQGRLRYGEVHAGQYQMTGELSLSGGLSPNPDQPGAYRFELFQTRKDGESPVGPTLTGVFDLHKLEVQAELADFAFADPHRNMLPRQIRKWWDLFEPSGSLPNIKFDYDPRLGPQAEVHIDGLAITLPQVSAGNYKARMTDVSGTFRFNSRRIEIIDLVGEIEGLEYRIDGEILGYSPDAPFKLTLKTRPFRVPEKPHYMIAMPLPVQKVFRMITPVGWMRVSAVLSRHGAGDEIDYRGSATILSGRDVLAELIGNVPRDQWPEVAEKMHLSPDSPALVSKGMYHKFPYELTNCRGHITFNREKITVNSLTGAIPGGGTATIQGTIGPLSDEAEVDLTVTAVNVHFDAHLKNALPPDQRRALEMFMHEESFQRMLRAEHFVTSDEREADELTRLDLNRRIRELSRLGRETAAQELKAELERLLPRLELPVFDLGGRGNVLVQIKGQIGPDKPLQITTAIDLAGTNVIFEFFPYPVRVTGGRVTIGPEGAHFDAVTGEGLHGGSGMLRGTVHHKGRIVPELQLVTTGLPIDRLLLAALPDQRSGWLERLRVTGKLDVTGRILRDPDADRIDVDLNLALNDGTARPGQGNYLLEQLAGRMRMSLHHLSIERLTARHGESRIELAGDAQLTGDQSLTLNAKATNLRFEDAVLDLVAAAGDPSTMRAIWQAREPRGLFDAELDYKVAADKPSEYRLTVRPQSLDLRHEGYRLAMEAMTGSAVIEPGVVTLENFGGELDDATVAVDGRVRLGLEPDVAVALSAQGKRIGTGLRRLMPAPLAQTLGEMELKGGFELTMPHLTWGGDSGAGLALQGRLKLMDASARLGPRIEHMDGTVAIRLEGDAGDGAPRLALDIHADRADVAGRRVEDLTLQMRNNDGDESLVIPTLSGRCYGGQLGGSGALRLDNGDFHLQLAVANAALEQMADADVPDDKSSPDAQPVRGKVSASLAVQGNWKRPHAVRGRGDVLVRNGTLTGVPLAMGLLHIAHLQLPTTGRFDQAAISYYLRDGQAVFERIELASPNMKLSGAGTLQYDSSSLDLTLTTSNPRGLNLGPVTTIINSVRNQLVTLRITGTLDAPRVRVRQFNGLTEAWHDVFAPNKP